jgi:hypothetical protein
VVYAVRRSRSADAAVQHQLVDGQGEVVTVVSGFLQHLTNGEYSPNTIRAYACDLRHFFNFLQSLELDWNTSARSTESNSSATYDTFRSGHEASDALAWLRSPSTAPGTRR